MTVTRSYSFSSETFVFEQNSFPNDFSLVFGEIQLGNPTLTECSNTLTNGGPPFAKDPTQRGSFHIFDET